MELANKSNNFKSFGWNVIEVNGHDIGELYDVFTLEKNFNGPTAIIAKTIKGKGS